MTNLDEKGLPFTVRTVFIIDDKKTVRLSLQYPASTGRQFNEILRCIDSLQLTDKEKVATPQGWTPGDKVIVHNSLKTEDAKKHFEGKQVEEVVSLSRARSCSAIPLARLRVFGFARSADPSSFVCTVPVPPFRPTLNAKLDKKESLGFE